MWPFRSTFQCYVATHENVSLARELLTIRETPTLDRILTIFEERLALLAEQKKVPRAVCQIPRILEYKGKSLTTDEALRDAIKSGKKTNDPIPLFQLPYGHDQLFEKSTFENLYCAKPARSSIEGPFDRQLDVLKQSRILQGTYIFKIITFVNNGPVAWPPHIQCHSQLTRYSPKSPDVVRVQLPVQCEKGILPGDKLEIVLQYVAPFQLGYYTKSLQLYTDQGVPFGNKLELFFCVDTMEHIQELMAEHRKTAKKLHLLKLPTSTAPKLTVLPAQLRDDNILLDHVLKSLQTESDSKPMEALDAKIDFNPFENDSLHRHLFAVYYIDTELEMRIKITNTGTMAWLPGVCLKQTFTHLHTNEKIVEDLVQFNAEFLPNEDVEGISLQIKAPPALGPYILELQFETNEDQKFGKALYFPMHIVGWPSEEEMHAFGFEEKRAHLTRHGIEKHVAESTLRTHNLNLNEALEALLTEN